jgi:hypothetical protein
VPANLVAAIRTSKPALLAYLRSRPVCAECRRPIVEPVRSWWGGAPVHHACGVAAWERDWGDRAAEALRAMVRGDASHRDGLTGDEGRR